MLSSLRGPDGGPALHVRLLALVVVVAMLAVTVPAFVVPLLRYLAGLVF